jgi:hypothetical protein
MKHPQAWNWDSKGGRNLCYKHNQQSHFILLPDTLQVWLTNVRTNKLINRLQRNQRSITRAPGFKIDNIRALRPSRPRAIASSRPQPTWTYMNLPFPNILGFQVITF